MFHISDTVVSGLLGHEAHAVVEADRGELAHFGPLVLIRIIVYHVSKGLASKGLAPCNKYQNIEYE